MLGLSGGTIDGRHTFVVTPRGYTPEGVAEESLTPGYGFTGMLEWTSSASYDRATMGVLVLVSGIVPLIPDDRNSPPCPISELKRHSNVDFQECVASTGDWPASVLPTIGANC